MKRSKMGYGVVFGAFLLGACSAGTGGVGVELFGDRDPVATGRDTPAGGGRDTQGTPKGGQTGTATATQNPPKPKASATATPTASTTPPTSTCPKCGNYACSGTVNGMPLQTTLNLQSVGGAGGCSDGNTTLTCDGSVNSGGLPGTWKTVGTALSLTGGSFTLACVPM